MGSSKPLETIWVSTMGVQSPSILATDATTGSRKGALCIFKPNTIVFQWVARVAANPSNNSHNTSIEVLMAPVFETMNRYLYFKNLAKTLSQKAVLAPRERFELPCSGNSGFRIHRNTELCDLGLYVPALTRRS